MTWQDAITISTFALAIAGVIFALGKQAQSIATNRIDINNIGHKFEIQAERTDRRLDDIAKFVIRVDQRVLNLERQVYGEVMTEVLRGGMEFHPRADDTDFS